MLCDARPLYLDLILEVDVFQTDLNHFFQSFASEPLTAFMRWISAIGYVEFFTVFLFVTLLAINLKKGFLLFMILLWTGEVTFIAKDYFDYPRPFHVDNTLAFLDGQLPDDTDFSFIKRGAKGFWDPLPADVLEVTRASNGLENGFPSGHTSIAIAFWGAMLLLFKSKWVKVVSVFLMLLIPLSRIYLGVHFLADVLGGIALGGFMLGIFYVIVLSREKQSTFLNRNQFDIGFNKHSLVFLVLPLPFLYILPPRVTVVIAIMLGLGLGYLLLSRKGIPLDDGTVMQRIGRLLLCVGAAAGMGYLLKLITDALGWGDHSATSFMLLFVFFIVLIWIGVEVSVRLGMYRRE